MKDYIERDAAKEAVCTVILHDGIRDALKSCIDDVPAADVRPVVRGEWIGHPECLKYMNAYADDHIVCSACEECFSILDNDCERFNFCPNCGADLRGEN